MLHRLLPLAALLAAAGLATPAAAQTYLGLTVEGGIPQNDFEDGLDDVGFGASGHLLVQVGAAPVALGLDGGLLTYGQQARPFATQLGDQSALLGDVETTNNVAHLHAVVRIVPSSGAVRPYADGLAGFNYLYTRTRFDQEVFLVDGGDVLDLGSNGVRGRRVTTSTDLDDVALSYGFGAGVLLRVAAGEDDGTPFEAFLEIGARYLFGEKATYLREGPVVGDRLPAVQLVESETDLLRPQIGLVIQFGS